MSTESNEESGRVEIGGSLGGAAEVGANPVFEVRDLSVVFKTDSEPFHALKGVDLKVPRGQFLCILGPSGQGKTTLLRVLAGLLTPTAGTVLAEGEPVTGPGADRGMVFQQDAIPLWKKVEENISFGVRMRNMPKAERQARAAEIIEEVGLKGFENSWPKQLSGGMRKRVAVGAVFANDPGALLMDEPFGALDYFTRSNLHALLLRLWAETQKTVVFVTHDVDEAIKLADRIVIVRRGKISEDLTVDLPRPRTEEMRSQASAADLRLHLISALQQQDPEVRDEALP